MKTRITVRDHEIKELVLEKVKNMFKDENIVVEFDTYNSVYDVHVNCYIGEKQEKAQNEI